MMERSVVILEFLRGLVRPVITISTVGSGIYLGVMEALGRADTPEWFIGFISIVFLYWFKTRDEEKLRDELDELRRNRDA